MQRGHVCVSGHMQSSKGRVSEGPQLLLIGLLLCLHTSMNHAGPCQRLGCSSRQWEADGKLIPPFPLLLYFLTSDPTQMPLTNEEKLS